MAIARIDTPLKAALAEQGRRQDWLARQIGASPDQVSRWANGIHEPADRTKELIAEALERDVADLFPADDREPAA